MMKMIMGFLGSYSDGLEPSSIPPWAGALAVEVLVAEVTVVVSKSVTVLVIVAMPNGERLAPSPTSWRLSSSYVCTRVSGPITIRKYCEEKTKNKEE